MMIRGLTPMQNQTLAALARLFRRVRSLGHLRGALYRPHPLASGLQIERSPATKMTVDKLGTSVGATLFPGLSVQRASDVLRFLVDRVDTLWPATAAPDALEADTGGAGAAPTAVVTVVASPTTTVPALRTF